MEFIALFSHKTALVWDIHFTLSFLCNIDVLHLYVCLCLCGAVLAVFKCSLDMFSCCCYWVNVTDTNIRSHVKLQNLKTAEKGRCKRVHLKRTQCDEWTWWIGLIYLNARNTVQQFQPKTVAWWWQNGPSCSKTFKFKFEEVEWVWIKLH